MEKREYTVYKFAELPEEAKQKALERYYNINIDHPDWYMADGLLDVEQSKWVKYGLKDCLFQYKELYFDLERGQYLQFEDLKVTDREIFRQALGLSKRVWEKIDYSFDSERNNNTTLRIESLEGDNLTEKETVAIREAEETFSDWVNTAWVNLRDDYEYQTSEKAIVETFEANGYDFTLEGHIS